MNDFYDAAYHWRDINYVMGLTISEMYQHRSELIRIYKENTP